MNFKQPDVFRYTEENPYVSTGMNRNTVKGKKYVGAYGDLAEFNDLFMRHKNGLDIDEFVPSSCYIARKNYIDLLDINSQKVKLVGNTIKAFISSGSKEPRSALESRRVSLGAHWVD